jgi:simple sugar transport system permease protein
LQTRGSAVPTQLVQMLPYVVTLVALVGVVGRARPPAALGRTED